MNVGTKEKKRTGPKYPRGHNSNAARLAIYIYKELDIKTDDYLEINYSNTLYAQTIDILAYAMTNLTYLNIPFCFLSFQLRYIIYA